MVMSEAHAFVGKHFQKSDLELYVINALAMERAAEVEDHVAQCEACADALAREAQLELAMELLAERVAAPAPVVRIAPVTRVAATRVAPVTRMAPRRVARIAGGLAGALAAAAAVVLWLAPTKADDDVARYGAVSSDASGAMVSFEAAPRTDTLDGG
jgi:anti-sigma factor RsiW